MNCGKKIPDTLILVIYLPPAMLFFSFFKKIPDILILVIYLPPAMLFLISQKISDMLILMLYLLFTPNYAIVSCVKKFRYHFSSYSIRGNYFFFAFGNPEVTVHKPKGHST